MSVELRPIMPNTIQECCQVCEALRDKKPVRQTSLDVHRTTLPLEITGEGFIPNFAEFRYDLLEEVQTQVELPELCYVKFWKEDFEWNCVAITTPQTLGCPRQTKFISLNSEEILWYHTGRLSELKNLQFRVKSTDPWQPVFKTEFKIKPFNK